MKKNKIVSLAGYLSLSLISLIAIEASQNMPRIIDFATQKFPKLTNKAKEVVGQIRETIDYEEMVITSPPTPPSKLEKKVESFIQEERKKDHVLEDERTAWFVYDLSAQEKVVSINEDLPLQAASMIKPFVALAFYHLEKQGKDINLLGCELCHRQDASVYDFHHIVFKSEAPHHPELNNPRNIIYVCRSCHMFLHGSKRENRKHLIKERKLDELFSTGSKVPIRLY